MIKFNSIGVKFNNSKTSVEALKDVNLEIGVEFLSVLGPSGCGKSTILRLLAGLQRPTDGEIEINSEEDFSYGIVFQDYSLLPWLDVRENLELGLQIQKAPEHERTKVSAHLLKQLDLEEAANLLPHQLSGGMRQRVAVGRAFAQSPTLLLMDEPFGALDAFARMELQLSLSRLYEDNPHTVVFVTHDVEEAVFLGDRVCVLTERPGRVRRMLDINFARPRDKALKRSSEFLDICYEIEDMLTPP